MELEKDIPGKIRSLLREYGYSEYPGGPSPAVPRVFWASAPVRPNETVLLQGSDLGGAAVVEAARLDDGEAAEPAAAAKVKTWTRLPLVQQSDCSLKFTLPAGWKPGVFACRVIAGGSASSPVLLNAPDPWWMQGDSGQSATSGGWLRIFGKSLVPRIAARSGLQPSRERPSFSRRQAATTTPCGWICPAASNRGATPSAFTMDWAVRRLAQGGRDAASTPPRPWPTKVFNVLEIYGNDAAAQMRKTLNKYSPGPDRTAGIKAALRKAQNNGGGVVYFPAGRYGIKGDIDVPPRTVLRGEGMGLVVLWWGRADSTSTVAATKAWRPASRMPTCPPP